MFKNLMLGTTRFFLRPDEEGGSGGGEGNDNEEVQPTAGEGSEQEGDVSGSDEVDADDEGEGSEDDEEAEEELDPDEVLAGVTDPKVKAALEKKIAKETRWRDKQIARATRRQNDLNADNEALRAIAEGRAPATGGPKKDEAGNIVMTQAELDAEIQRQARAAAAKGDFDAQCNAADADGRKRFKDKWNTAMNKLPAMGGLDNDTLQGIIATDDPAQVLYTLASDPDEYERVMELPPAKRQTALVKLALPKPGAKKSSVKEPSKAAAPTTPAGGPRGKMGLGKVDLYDDKVSDDDWYAKRNAERRKKFSNVA